MYTYIYTHISPCVCADPPDEGVEVHDGAADVGGLQFRQGRPHLFMLKGLVYIYYGWWVGKRAG